MGIKIKDIIKWGKISAAVAKPFVPGAAGTALDAVLKNIPDQSDPQNTESLKLLAENDDQQDLAILALHERLKKVEEKVK